MSVATEIELTVNGRPARAEVPVDMSALDMLRDVLSFTGTKYACGEGECGACTILVDGESYNSCLMYAVELEGREIVTIEGLRTSDGLDPMQEAFVDYGAIQCGYCMPGMIMQAKYLVEQKPDLTLDELKRGLEGNVCRCTGYTKVFDAVAAVTGLAS